MNVALYGPLSKRWAMTERSKFHVGRTEDCFEVGPSSLSWNGTTLTANIDERTTPLNLPIRGQIRLHPENVSRRTFALDAATNHVWWPIAPAARVEVDLHRPALKWRGSAYCDSNFGHVPLERSFKYWNWSRAHVDGGTRILYDIECRNGDERSIALNYTASGDVLDFEAPPETRLPGTLWRVPRSTRTDSGHRARVVKTLEDTPFYTRSVISTHLDGDQAAGMHESLCLDRFSSRWVRTLLPYRMPRVL